MPSGAPRHDGERHRGLASELFAHGRQVGSSELAVRGCGDGVHERSSWQDGSRCSAILGLVSQDRAFSERHTERLLIRRFRPKDGATFAGYRSDPDVARYQSWDGYSLIEAERFIADIADADPGAPDEWFQFAVADTASDGLMGDVALRIEAEDFAHAELGFTFAPEHQGKGYATEAVAAVLGYARERLGVTVVFAIVDGRNQRSIALLERIGMRRVATERARFKGGWCDEHRYELELA
jgi:RimJ/RimL family protein N-acetyltransferase